MSNAIFSITRWSSGAAIAGLSLIVSGTLSTSASAADFADFLFVVDESGSMNQEHAWLGGMIMSLEAGLQAKGVGLGVQRNGFGLIGFGSRGAGLTGRSLLVGGQQFGSATAFAAATESLVTSGGIEDGYAALDFAFSNYQFRENAAVNVVLVTDEDRDIVNHSVSFGSILSTLQQHDALLNAVVNYSAKDTQGNEVIGADGHGNAFVADGAGGYTKTTFDVANSGIRGANSTVADYVNLAWATGNSTVSGAAWNLNVLRAGGSNAASFTRAFVDIKASEAARQGVTPEAAPEPGTTLLVTGMVLGLGKKLKSRMAKPSRGQS